MMDYTRFALTGFVVAMVLNCHRHSRFKSRQRGPLESSASAWKCVHCSDVLIKKRKRDVSKFISGGRLRRVPDDVNQYHADGQAYRLGYFSWFAHGAPLVVGKGQS